jgi:hypothetical protein
LYGCETRSLTLKEEHYFREFENRALETYLDLKGMNWQEAGENCKLRGVSTRNIFLEDGSDDENIFFCLNCVKLLDDREND